MWVRGPAGQKYRYLVFFALNTHHLHAGVRAKTGRFGISIKCLAIQISNAVYWPSTDLNYDNITMATHDHNNDDLVCMFYF